jgi:antitoxin YefM
MATTDRHPVDGVSRGGLKTRDRAILDEAIDLRAAPTTNGSATGPRARSSTSRRKVVRILTMSEAIPFTEVKAHLSELVDRVWREHDRVVVTRNGRPVAVLISPDELEGLEETVELLADDDARASLRRAEAEDEAGQAEILTYEQARERFGSR